jgi:hypothetical protein
VTDRHNCVWTGGLCSSGTVNEQGEAIPAVSEAPDALCPHCEKHLEKCVSELSEMWLQLAVSVGEKSMRRSDKVSGTRTLQVPINLDIDTLKTEVLEWLVAAAARVSEALNTSDPAPRLRRSHVARGEEHHDSAATSTDSEHGEVVIRCVRLLLPHLDKLIAAPSDTLMVWRRKYESDESGEWYKDTLTAEDMSGAEIAGKLARAHKTGQRILGHTNSKIKQKLVCPLCLEETLFRTVRATTSGRVVDEVHCETCDMTRSHEHYETMCKVSVNAIKEERVTEEERLVAWFAAEELWEQLQDALGRLERLERGLYLAGTPEFAALPAGQFAREVLGEAA